MSYYQNQNRNNGQSNYVRSSSCTKTLHFNNEQETDQSGNVVVDRNGQPRARREKVALTFDVTEEFSITLTPPKVQDLINRLTEASQDRSGTGGVRISMYARRSVNDQTKEEFDGLSLLVKAQQPQQNQQQGRFQGRGQGNFKGGGRREYPPRGQAQGAGQPQQQQRAAIAPRKPAQAPAAPAEREDLPPNGAPF